MTSLTSPNPPTGYRSNRSQASPETEPLLLHGLASCAARDQGKVAVQCLGAFRVSFVAFVVGLLHLFRHVLFFTIAPTSHAGIGLPTSLQYSYYLLCMFERDLHKCYMAVYVQPENNSFQRTNLSLTVPTYRNQLCRINRHNVIFLLSCFCSALKRRVVVGCAVCMSVRYCCSDEKI